MTKTDVANFALTELGIDLINDIDDKGREARYCKRYIDLASKIVFEEQEWTNLVEIAADLTEDEAYTNDSEYEYVFDLPSDFLIPISVNFEETPLRSFDPIYRIYRPGLTVRRSVDYVIEDSHLFTNESEVDLRYVKGAVDEVTGAVVYSDRVGLCIGYRLAIMIAPKLAPDRKAEAERAYGRALVEAAASNATIRRPRQDSTPWW